MDGQVKQWKQQQSMQNEAREESNMDEEERVCWVLRSSFHVWGNVRSGFVWRSSLGPCTHLWVDAGALPRTCVQMKKRTELLRELHKQQDEMLSSARDPLTAQAYARENATTGDDGSIRAEDRVRPSGIHTAPRVNRTSELISSHPRLYSTVV